MTAGKGKEAIKLQARPGNFAGGLFGVRLGSPRNLVLEFFAQVEEEDENDDEYDSLAAVIGALLDVSAWNFPQALLTAAGGSG